MIDDLLVGRDHNRVEAVRLKDGRCCAVEPLEIHDDVVVYGKRVHAHAETGVAEGAIEEKRIPVVEEKVAIGKRVSDHGKGITVRQRVVSDSVSEAVTVRDETVSVDKHKVGKRLGTAEVVLRKTAADKTEHVTETVRKTEVDLDKTRGDHDRRR